MNRYPCSGCGEHECDGSCYNDTPLPPTIDELMAIAVADLRRKYAAPEDQLTETKPDPLPRRAA